MKIRELFEVSTIPIKLAENTFVMSFCIHYMSVKDANTISKTIFSKLQTDYKSVQMETGNRTWMNYYINLDDNQELAKSRDAQNNLYGEYLNEIIPEICNNLPPQEGDSQIMLKPDEDESYCKVMLIGPDLPKYEINSETISIQFGQTYGGSLLGVEKCVGKDTKELEITGLAFCRSGGLGLMRLPKTIQLSNYNRDWYNIIYQNRKEGKSVLDCQEELIDNNFEEYARLQ